METMDLELFRDLETRLHRKEVRNSPEEVSELLADDFVEFGSSGMSYDKNTTLKSLLKEENDFEIEVRDFKAEHLSADVVLVSYISSKFDPTTNQKFDALRSSTWKLNNGKWQMCFHQGTRIE